MLQSAFYLPPTLRRHNRILGKFDYQQDYMNFIKDPQLREERMRSMKDRSLLIGGGSEPRETLLLDKCQFLNNSLTPNILIPSFAANGVVDIFTAFTDLIVKDCLFKDNYYPYSRTVNVRKLIVIAMHIKKKTQLSTMDLTFPPYRKVDLV